MPQVCVSVKRALLYGKRDLFIYQKRPINISIPEISPRRLTASQRTRAGGVASRQRNVAPSRRRTANIALWHNFQRNSREIPEKFQDKMSIRKCQSSIPSRQSKIPSSQSNPFSQKFQDKSKMSVPENVVRRVRSGKGETERGYF